MPRARIKPNPQLKQIVLEETNEGRDIVRFLKSTFMKIEDGVSLFGLRHKDYARSHKIAAARILARIGLEEGKRYLRRTYVQTPFKRVHPEDEDGPKRDMAASTAELYRLVKKETNDGRDIIIRFVGIMKGYHPEYKPHLRMAAAKELIRQIEFDYEDEPAETATASTYEPVGAYSEITVHQSNHANHSSDANPIDNSKLAIENSDSVSTDQLNPDYPVHPAHPDSDKITTHPTNHTNHSSDQITSDRIRDFANPYTQYASRNCAEEAESIYHSIIRRSTDQPDPDSARSKATELIEEFNQFMAERDPEYQPITVPADLLARSLTQRMQAPESYLFDPADFFDLDRDDFYYCRCGGCEECDELDYFFEFMYELQEDYDNLFEDP